MNADVKLCPIELPGRSGKQDEPLCTSIEEMAEHVFRQLDTETDEYCLFGHSMGVYVLTEVYAKIVAEGRRLPAHIILSGMRPPHLYKHKGYHLLDEAGFRSKMQDMGGIPKALIDDEDFAVMLFRLLRNDIRAVEQYAHIAHQKSFSCSVSLFNSESDIASETMLQWERYAQHPCSYYKFQGTHFFINEYTSVGCRNNESNFDQEAHPNRIMRGKCE